jgi:hypothetical protein
MNAATKSAIAKYQRAIDTLYAMGLKQTGFVDASQRRIRSILGGRRGLAAFDIDPVTKAILTTRENWALAAALVAQCEEALDMALVSPGRDWIHEIENRAYRMGNEFQGGMYKALGNKLGAGMRGIDATTLRYIKQAGYKQIVGLADSQIEYLRVMLTKGVVEKRTWQAVTNQIINEGKIPALVTRDGRLIDMGTRIDTMVRTETSRIAEQGTRDKARELYGGELAMTWNTIIDGRERKSHAVRNGLTRLVRDWETLPLSYDGKAIMPGEEPNCRCFGTYGTMEELKKAA